jgi:hypothetical protein
MLQNLRRRLVATGSLAFAMGGLATAQAAALVDQVTLVEDATAAASPIPLNSGGQSFETFSVTQAGSYSIAVRDLLNPTALAALNVSVSSSVASAATLSSAGTSKVSTVTLQPGTYTVQTLATAASGSAGGELSVVITAPDGSKPINDAWTVSAPSTPVAGQSVLQTKFTVTSSADYGLTITDRSFPAALSANTLSWIVLNDATQLPVTGASRTKTNPGNWDLGVLAAGAYDLTVVAQANSTALAALYSVSVASTGASPVTVLGSTVPVGKLVAAGSFSVPTTETVTLAMTDLAFPASLASFQGIATQGASVLNAASGTGTKYSLAATGTASAKATDPVGKGVVQIFTQAQPAPVGQGAYALYAHDTTTLLDVATPATDTSHVAYGFSSMLTTGGAYQLSASDFRAPAALSALSAVAEQQGAALGSVGGASSGSTPNLPTVQSGPINFVAFATPASSSGATTANQGLFGLTLATAPTSGSGTTVYEITQGVGALFSSTPVVIATAGAYVLQVTDLQFPTAMGSLGVFFTRGQSVAAEIFGTNQLVFNVATPGTYVANVLTQVGTTTDYGLYGVRLMPAPAAPTVTLTAAPTSVSSGGTATLTWAASSTAVSCTGSWAAGSLMASGTATTAAISATTTYSITCADQYGQTGTATAQVSLDPPASKGGGGAETPDLLIVLAGLVALRFRQRVARSMRSGLG